MREVREPVLFVKHPIAKETEEREVRSPEVSVVYKRSFVKDPRSVQGLKVH